MPKFINTIVNAVKGSSAERKERNIGLLLFLEIFLALVIACLAILLINIFL